MTLANSRSARLREAHRANRCTVLAEKHCSTILWPLALCNPSLLGATSNAPQPGHYALQLEDTDRSAHSNSRKKGRLPRPRDRPAAQAALPEAPAFR